MAENRLIHVSDERAVAIYRNILNGSKPEARFYFLVAASTVIASLGLIMNSTAVVIGAMLVAPLMTPIFGIALALVRGNAILLGRAMTAEILGVCLTIVIAACIGLLMPELEASDEMLSRTRPNLLDLLVALFAGLAGAYALVDEKLSPALPGVAISTAIVPPLANCGLCLSLRAYEGASGSFLLFFANFLSILLVASGVFLAARMNRRLHAVGGAAFARRFGPALIGFIVITILLSQGLARMVSGKRLSRSIEEVLSEEFSHLPATALEEVLHEREGDTIYVLAHVHASGDITPSRVTRIEESLESELGESVDLYVRSTLSRDISSAGAGHRIITETLDGLLFGSKPDPRIQILKTGEQIIREYLDTQLGLYVEELNLLPIGEGHSLLATVFGVRRMDPEEIESLESEIREKTRSDSLTLVIRHIDLKLLDRWGEAHYEWLVFDDLSPDEEAKILASRDFLRTWFDSTDYALRNVDFTSREGEFHVLAEITGPTVYSRDEFEALRARLSENVGSPVHLYVRSSTEVVVTEDGFRAFETVQEDFRRQLDAVKEQQIDRAVEEAL